MKSRSFIIISLIFAIFSGCTNHKCLKSKLIGMQDSPIFEDYSIDYIGNNDSVYKSVEFDIINYLGDNQIEMPKSQIDMYNVIESVVHKIYDYKEPIENEWQLYDHLSTTCSQLRFLNEYLIRRISKISDNRLLTQLLYNECELIDSLECNQHRFLKAHFDYADKDTTHRLLKYYQASLSILNDRNEDLKDLFFSMVDTSYNNSTKYLNLSNRLFNQEYSHIYNSLILDNRNNLDYNVTMSQNAIESLKQTWFDFIAKREEIAKLLLTEHQNVWRNSTYRYQRSHLIILKNEFEELGLLGSELATEIILSDTCTYEELISYSNFSTKWKEYNKKLYISVH